MGTCSFKNVGYTLSYIINIIFRTNGTLQQINDGVCFVSVYIAKKCIRIFFVPFRWRSRFVSLRGRCIFITRDNNRTNNMFQNLG